jgi:uncharacterized protein YjiK
MVKEIPMKRTSSLCTALACFALALAMTACANPTEMPSSEADPRSIVFEHEWIADIDQIDFNEPSGIVYHVARGTLFVVGDEGDICEIETDGRPVKQAHIRDADFEGVTYDPATGLLYVVIEGDDRILEVHPDELKVLREFEIERAFQGRMLLKPGGQGVECITFVPDAAHPQGGTFYIGNQSFDAAAEDDPSVICQVEVPLRDGGPAGGEAKIVRYFSLGIADFAAFHYDAESDHLYVVSDANNMLLEMTRGGRVVDFWAFPGDNQEGIAMDPQGFVYIAQDSGGILKVRWRRDG